MLRVCRRKRAARKAGGGALTGRGAWGLGRTLWRCTEAPEAWAWLCAGPTQFGLGWGA